MVFLLAERSLPPCCKALLVRFLSLCHEGSSFCCCQNIKKQEGRNPNFAYHSKPLYSRHDGLNTKSPCLKYVIKNVIFHITASNDGLKFSHDFHSKLFFLGGGGGVVK